MDDQGYQRFVKQVFDLWVNPEIERRRQRTSLAADFRLARAQVIMNLDKPHEIRLNDEVSAVMFVDVHEHARAGMRVGQPIFWDEIDKINDIQLTERDPNAGHITMVGAPDGRWLVVFDFRYNAARVTDVVAAAEEFLAVALFASSKGHARAFSENLFAATELTAKGSLLLLPEPRVLDAKSHRFIAQKLNLYSRLGNMDHRFVKLHNDLAARRGDARYVQGTISFSTNEMSDMISIVRTTLDHVNASTPRRVPLPQPPPQHP